MNRIYLLDELRGFAILAMLVQHLCYTMLIFGLDERIFHIEFSPLLESLWMEWVHLPFALLFVFLSGICCSFSHSNLRRGGICFLLGVCITLVTWFLGMPDWFGILHLLGLCMILYGLIGRYAEKLPFWWTFGILMVLGFATYGVGMGYLGLPGLKIVQLPPVLYQYDWLCFLGFPSPTFASLDYFPMLPWMFFFFAGGVFGRRMTQTGWPEWMKKRHCTFFGATGRHTLVIYLVHQPVFFGLCWLLARLLG